MNRFLYIVIFTLLFASCSDKTKTDGYWRLNFEEEPENPFFPYELRFHLDTLQIVDGYNFKQTSIFSNLNDSISITFASGIRKNYYFKVLSDSTIKFADQEFVQASIDYFTKSQSYELFGWKSTQEFRPQINSPVIHLIKDSDSTKVILNDITTDLKHLPDFLIWRHGQQPTIYLYVGKGIELKDVLDAYCWIKYSGYRKVELVTSNVSFEKFYSIEDYVDVDDSTFMKFLNQNSLPSPPPAPESDKKIYDVLINSKSNITFGKQLDSVTYRYNFSSQLDIKEYLELIEKLNNSEKKILKRLTTLYKMH